MFYSNRNINVKSLKSKENIQKKDCSSIPLAFFCGCAARFLSDLDGNTGESLSQDVAQIREHYKTKKANTMKQQVE